MSLQGDHMLTTLSVRKRVSTLPGETANRLRGDPLAPRAPQKSPEKPRAPMKKSRCGVRPGGGSFRHLPLDLGDRRLTQERRLRLQLMPGAFVPGSVPVADEQPVALGGSAG